MKKTLTLLLALSLCLSLCACGGEPKAAENPYEKYAKYAELFDYLEANDWDNANAYLRNHFGMPEESPTELTEPVVTEPVVTEPPVTEPIYETVEITMDNWQEYFELRVYDAFEANGFGEFERATTYFSLVSKDEFIVDYSTIENSSVTFEYTYTAEDKTASVDFENRTVIYGNTTGSRAMDPQVETMGNVGQYIGEDTGSRYGKYLTCNFLLSLEGNHAIEIVDFEILRIAGTFCFTRNN